MTGLIVRLLAILGLVLMVPAQPAMSAGPTHMSAAHGGDCEGDVGQQQSHEGKGACAQCAAVPCPEPRLRTAQLLPQTPAYPDPPYGLVGVLPELPTPPPK